MNHRPGERGRRGIAGFTLIELMVVLSLIVILASLGLVQYKNSVIQAREATLHEDLFRMRGAIDQYYADKNQYPPSLESLATDGYIRQVPKDPITTSSETWQVEKADPDPNNPTVETGITNVHSGSDQTALDGSKYSDW